MHQPLLMVTIVLQTIASLQFLQWKKRHFLLVVKQSQTHQKANLGKKCALIFVTFDGFLDQINVSYSCIFIFAQLVLRKTSDILLVLFSISIRFCLNGAEKRAKNCAQNKKDAFFALKSLKQPKST